MGFLGVALAAGGFHVKAANQVLKSAGGNYNDDNLSVGNVRPVAFGLSQTGTLANLAATDAAFLALEGTRNDPASLTNAKLAASAGAVKIKGTTYSGTLIPPPVCTLRGT